MICSASTTVHSNILHDLLPSCQKLLFTQGAETNVEDLAYASGVCHSLLLLLSFLQSIHVRYLLTSNSILHVGLADVFEPFSHAYTTAVSLLVHLSSLQASAALSFTSLNQLTNKSCSINRLCSGISFLRSSSFSGIFNAFTSIHWRFDCSPKESVDGEGEEKNPNSFLLYQVQTFKALLFTRFKVVRFTMCVLIFFIINT